MANGVNQQATPKQKCMRAFEDETIKKQDGDGAPSCFFAYKLIIIELKNRSRTIFSQAAKLLVAARMGGLNRLHSQPT